MEFGSSAGFTQWAATRKLHPALKTIVPSRAGNAGNGLPMENNVFLFVNYAWTFYTTNNKYLDNETYSDKRWNSHTFSQPAFIRENEIEKFQLCQN